MSVLWLAAGLVLVVAGAELFFEAVLGLASRLRVSAFALTALLSGFELENLAAGIAANLRGVPTVAAGTFLGGTTFLALGVAGVGAVIAPLDARVGGRALLWTAVSVVPLGALAADGLLSRVDGGLLLAWFAVVMTGLWRSAPPGPPVEARPVRFASLRLVGGLAILTAGGELLGRGVRGVVVGLGVPGALLGNTAIAASVEAEEIVRVALPARRGRDDVALGNILGTIAHFAAFNAGVIALVRPVRLDAPSLHLHLPVAVGSVLALCALAAWKGVLARAAGAVLVALYVAYVAGAVALEITG